MMLSLPRTTENCLLSANGYVLSNNPNCAQDTPRCDDAMAMMQSTCSTIKFFEHGNQYLSNDAIVAARLREKEFLRDVLSVDCTF